MADFLIRNSLNPGKVVKAGITFQQLVPKGGAGELIWVVEIATDEPHKDGGSIPPEYINLTTLDNIDEEIQIAVAALSEKIDWTPLDDDTREPIVSSCYPSSYIADIEDDVVIVISEILPSAGIDIDSITMTINDMDVTSELEITGDPYEYEVKWKPPIRIYDTE